MSFAGHLPTMVFEQATWLSMRVFEPKESWEWAGDGYYRASLNGKPIVGFIAPVDSGEVSFMVRPIVRVPMARA